MFFTVFAGGVNALLTNIQWFSSTGGVFGRYNYVPFITDSQGLQLYLMIITVFFAIVLKFQSNNFSKLKTTIINISIIIALFNMITIQVREGWLIFLLSLVISNYIYSGNKVRNLIISLFILSILIYYVFNQLDLITDIINDGESSESLLVRFMMIERSIDLFLANPIFGIGYGNFPLYITLDFMMSGGELKFISSPHNGLILIACELGIIGIIAVFYFCYSILYKFFISIYSKQNHNFKLFYTIFFCFFLLISLDQLISNSLFLPVATERSSFQFSVLFWMIISIFYSNNLSSYEKK